MGLSRRGAAGSIVVLAKGMRFIVSAAAMLCLSAFARPAEAQIAFDAASGPSQTNGSSHTFTHTASGTNRIVFAMSIALSSRSGMAVTYGGTPMTLISSVSEGDGSTIYLYYMVNPPTGSQQVVVSADSTGWLVGAAVSYTGASQTGVPDAYGTNYTTGAPSISQSVTSIADSCWFVAAAGSQGTVSAGSGATQRTSSETRGFFDSNGPKTPAGSYSMTVGFSSSTQGGIILASFAPPDVIPPAAPMVSSFKYDSAGRITEICGTSDGETVAVKVYDGALLIGTAVPAGGAWCLTLGTPLAAGQHSIYATAEDESANESPRSTTYGMGQSVNSVNAFKETAITHSGAASLRLEQAGSYDFKIAANASAPVTVKAWVRRNASYAGTAPSVTLTGLGIDGTGSAAASMAGGADAWEELTVSGTPDAEGVLTLRVETYAAAADAKAWVDDISVAQ